MKAIVATLAAAGMAVVFSLPAKAEGTATTNGASNSAAQVGNTDVSSQRRHYRRHYGHRYRPYAYRGQRYGYYRPYRYSRPYYAPGVSLGFWGGPRFGVWF
jgi:hypothetical protein